METNTIQMIKTEMLDPHPDNPRKDLGDLTELTASVKAMGVLSPLLVITKPDGNYRIVAGHRRAAAAKKAGVEEVPCIISKMSALEQQYAMWTENEQRQQLSPVEQAGGIQMMFDLGATVEEVAKKTGLTERVVKSRAEIAKLDRNVIAAREKDKDSYQLSIKDYEELSRVKSVASRNEILKKGIYSHNDLVSKVDAEIRKERVRKNLEMLKPEMKKRGFLKTNDSSITWSANWEILQNIDLSGKSLNINVEPDNDRQILWMESWGKLYIAAPKKESPEEQEKKKELAKEEIERKKAEKELDGLIKALREELDDFAHGIYNGKIACTIINGEALKRAWRLYADVGVEEPAEEMEDFLSEIVYQDREMEIEDLKKDVNVVMDMKSMLVQMMMCIHIEIRSVVFLIKDWRNRFQPVRAKELRRYIRLLEIAYQYDFGNEEYEDIIDGTHPAYAKDEA